jgi:hypothetical protein
MCRRWRWLAPGLLAAGLVGCGPDHGLTLGRARGKVTYNGEPVHYGTVLFVPDATKGTDGPSAMGIIREDGTYELSTDSGGDGALVGVHKVGVVGLDPTPVNAQATPSPEEAPVDYMKSKAKAAQAATNPRRVAKASAEAAGETFTDRGGRTYRYVIPKRLGNPEESGLSATVARGSNTVNIAVREGGTAEITN